MAPKISANDPPPPAYDAVDDASAERIFDMVQRTTNRERDDSESNATEIRRLRKFLLYCLCIDYRYGVSLSLSAEDTKHFWRMCQTLSHAEDIHGSAALERSQRIQLGCYLWRFVYEPCKAMGIPAECAVVAIQRFGRHQSMFGHYKGCAYAILQLYGPHRLAEKLWIDIHTMIPRLVCTSTERNKMVSRVNDVADIYFVRIDGIEASIAPEEGSEPGPGHSQAQSMSYVLTARGMSYQEVRSETLQKSHSSGQLSPAHIFERLRLCFPCIGKARERVFSKDPVDECVPTASKATRWFISFPSRWSWTKTVHLPDTFEDRQMRGQCEV